LSCDDHDASRVCANGGATAGFLTITSKPPAPLASAVRVNAGG